METEEDRLARVKAKYLSFALGDSVRKNQYQWYEMRRYRETKKNS